MRRTLLAIVIALSPLAVTAADIVSYAIVLDDATLRVRGKTIRLFGIYVTDTRRSCDTTFRPTQCKTRAAVALESKIQGFVRCQPQAQHRDRSISAVCYIDGHGTLDPPIDLGAYLIRQGWAVALPDAPFEYQTLEKIARVNRRGVWGFQADEIIR